MVIISYIKRVVLVVITIGILLSNGVSADNYFVFHDFTWDSAMVHNRVAGFIAEHGFGLKPDYMMLESIPGNQGMRRGEIHVALEVWLDNTPEMWLDAIEEGLLVDLGPNYLSAPQGWYVPTYVIEGDPERGIEPMAPDLRSVFDLPDYWELFRDQENPNKGRFYNGITGWNTSEHNVVKIKTYGLDEYFDVFYPGSQAAADSAISRAYDRGEPWFGYYWEPTWIMGKYDLTMLEEPPYSPDCWDPANGIVACAFPSANVLKLVTSGFAEEHPEFVEFLKNYETELHHTSEMLAYMQENNARPEDAALWFLTTYEDVWTSWLDDDMADKIKGALNAVVNN